MKKEKNDNYPIPVYPVGMPIDPVVPVIADPLGSYTGRPADVLDTPVQYADDL